MIGVLHSGDLKKVSLGGISEYVKEFIRHSDSEIVLFGTVPSEGTFSLFKQYNIKEDGLTYTFIPINSDKKRPISLFYFVNLLFFFITHPTMLIKIKCFFAQRPEYVLPFLFIPKKKVAFCIHGSGKYASLFWGKKVAMVHSYLEKLSIKRADKVFILNNNPEFGLPYYKSKYKQFEFKLTYAAIPVNTDRFRTLNKKEVRKKYHLKEEDKIILFFGRLEHNPKRVLIFPDLLQGIQMKFPNTKMLIIGDGNDKEALMGKFGDKKLLKDIILYEYVSDRETLVELINCADVSLISSSFEGICMSAVESISCGIPVVATNVGDIPEYLINGENGFLVHNDTDANIVKDLILGIENIFNMDMVVNKLPIAKYEATKAIKAIEYVMVGER